MRTPSKAWRRRSALQPRVPAFPVVHPLTCCLAMHVASDRNCERPENSAQTHRELQPYSFGFCVCCAPFLTSAPCSPFSICVRVQLPSALEVSKRLGRRRREESGVERSRAPESAPPAPAIVVPASTRLPSVFGSACGCEQKTRKSVFFPALTSAASFLGLPPIAPGPPRDGCIRTKES